MAVGATTGHARGAYGSVRERLSKARTAFPVGPLARVGGGCMELDVPALITGGRLSVLVIRAATGVSRAGRTGTAFFFCTYRLLCLYSSIIAYHDVSYVVSLQNHYKIRRITSITFVPDTPRGTPECMIRDPSRNPLDTPPPLQTVRKLDLYHVRIMYVS